MFEKRGKYFYKQGSTHAYELKPCTGCGKEAFVQRHGGAFCSYECKALARQELVQERTVSLVTQPSPKKRGPKPGPAYVLSVDPGGVRNGWALFEHEQRETDSIFIRKGIEHFDVLDEFLENMSYVTTLVYETYVIRPGGRQNIGSTGKIMQAIGKLDMFAKTNGIRAYKQAPGVLPIAAKIAGVSLPKGHLNDAMSAYLHGVYYLRKRGWYLSALERSQS